MSQRFLVRGWTVEFLQKPVMLCRSSSPHTMRLLLFEMMFHCRLTRALMGLWISHGLMGGGGAGNPPIISAPRRHGLAKNGSSSKARQKPLQKCFCKFFVRVNIGVTRGHQRSNLAKCNISPEMGHYLRNFYR